MRVRTLPPWVCRRVPALLSVNSAPPETLATQSTVTRNHIRDRTVFESSPSCGFALNACVMDSQPGLSHDPTDPPASIDDGPHYSYDSTLDDFERVAGGAD